MTNFYMPVEQTLLLGASSEKRPMPLSLWRDYQIRHGMERAVLLDDQGVLALTKELSERELMPLLAVSIEHPFVAPGSESGEVDNRVLKGFAYDAYEHLATFFGDSDWNGWTIAPYYSQDDDMRLTMNVGLFVDESFRETVVE